MKAIIRTLLALLALAACTPDSAPNAALNTRSTVSSYARDAFEIAMPPSWTAGDLSEGPAAFVMFAPPGAERALLHVFMVNTGTELDEAAFSDAMDEYLAASHNRTLDVLDRAAMGDGSWRATGVRHRGALSFPVNIFMQRDGTIFSALEVTVPASDSMVQTLLTATVNSYKVTATAAWPVGQVSAVPNLPAELVLASGNLSFSGLFTWTGPDGVFHITGRLANHAQFALSDVTVRANLFDDAGQEVARETAATPLHVLLDGEYAPFDVRFAVGRPSDALRYTLVAEGEQTEPGSGNTLGAEAFTWEDDAQYDEAGDLHVSGLVTNVTQQSAVDVQAVVTLFSGRDEVLGHVVVDQTDLLPSGETSRFDIPIPEVGAPPVRYLITFQARQSGAADTTQNNGN